MKNGISAGKKRGLKAVANSRGVIAALAIDQRNALRKLFSKAMNIEAEKVPTEVLVQYKEAVSRALTPYASAILLDPEYGLSAARSRAQTCGLLLAYEKTGYDKLVHGRLPALLENWTVQRLVEAGADSIKLLLYYSSTSSADVNEQKHKFVERVGEECRQADIPFFLELVSYAEGLEDKSVAFARIKPEVVTRSMREFSKPNYGVDVLKVGVPVNLEYVEGSPSSGKEIVHSRSEAMDFYWHAAEAASVPFIYLSQGVTNETFQYGLELATEAGVPFSGVLCGRATWKDGVDIFVKHGPKALEDWLQSTGAGNIKNVNARLAGAKPWYSAISDWQPNYKDLVGNQSET
jgi:tagatose 1,6-diphosphate aldolase